MKIKFKIWDRKLNKFISWDALPTHDFESEEYSYCLFTGLLDKNGQEIYENDIISGLTPNHQNKVIDLVSFEDGSFVWNGSGYNLNDFSDLEKLGNIYENNELLK